MVHVRFPVPLGADLIHLSPPKGLRLKVLAELHSKELVHLVVVQKAAYFLGMAIKNIIFGVPVITYYESFVSKEDDSM